MAASAPSLLTNEGFPLLPDPDTDLMNINRYIFTEKKSPEILHKYWWLFLVNLWNLHAGSMPRI